jgi:hypothetical protein
MCLNITAWIINEILSSSSKMKIEIYKIEISRLVTVLTNKYTKYNGGIVMGGK